LDDERTFAHSVNDFANGRQKYVISLAEIDELLIVYLLFL
jgi:hypothetical protein